MDQLPENTSAAERASQGTKKVPESAKNWLTEISAAKQYLRKFHDNGDKINSRYLDTRGDQSKAVKKYNLFTVNVQILISTLYAKFPSPEVSREWDDTDDDVARVASTILERNLKVRERDDFDAAMKHCVVDRLVPGMAQVWFRYVPTIIKETVPNLPDPTTGQYPAGPDGVPQETQEVERLIYEDVVTDYVYWKDFFWSPARVWEEVRWVARAFRMNKMDAEARFGAEIAGALKYTKGITGDVDGRKTNNDDEDNQVIMYATVFELWCKRTRHVYWVSEGYDFVMDKVKDPFELLNFWPCPKPWMALLSTGSTVPRADYLMIEDQYEALDQINNRINYLERAVKVVGIYDKTQKELGRIFTENADNVMIAAESFAQFAEKGGFKGVIDWMPLADITQALEKLRIYRQDLIQQIYELSGISDIMRGATKASETLGAQELKAQYGGVRLQAMQMECALFVEEALDIRSKIMVKFFQPQTLLARANMQFIQADQKYTNDAIALLKDNTMAFRIKVHADTMAVPEFNAERDARLQFARTMAEFMTAMTPMIQQEPGSAPFLLKTIQWVAAGFRVGRTIEGVLDEAIDAAQKKLAAPKPPPQPTPTEVAVIKKDESTALLNVAKAAGQAIENAALKDDPSSITETGAQSKGPDTKPPKE